MIAWFYDFNSVMMGLCAFTIIWLTVDLIMWSGRAILMQDAAEQICEHARVVAASCAESLF